MFAKLVNFWGTQNAAHVIAIAPEDHQTINFRAVFKPFSGRYSYIRSVARIAWKYGLLLEMLCHSH